MPSPNNTLLKGFSAIADLFTVILIWVPLFLFIRKHRTTPGEHDGEFMQTFEVINMEWPDILLFFFLCVASFSSQIRLILVSQDLSEFEALKRKHEELQEMLRQQNS